ncbi:MAG: hypothetical protein QM730_25350 [Anaerolineales bacterium]
MIENPNSHADQLAKVGVFNSDDLEVNRSGHLAESQKRKLYFNVFLWLTVAGLEAIVFLGLAWIEFLIQGDLVLGVIAIGVFIALGSMCIENAKPFWEDIQEDNPKTASGTLYKHFSLTGGSTKGSRIAHCSIRVNDQIFAISPGVYGYIVHEGHYRVYYVPKSRTIINIEPLS